MLKNNLEAKKNIVAINTFTQAVFCCSTSKIGKPDIYLQLYKHLSFYAHE